jgi:dienelactone hydrolase
MSARALGAALLLAALTPLAAEETATLPGTEPLTLLGDLSAQMVAGIDRFLMREIEEARKGREKLWKRDLSSPEAYSRSVEPNRERLRKIIGAVDPRLPVNALEHLGTTTEPALVASTDDYRVFAVRWPVFEGVHGEGLLLEPKGTPAASVVAIPDADQTPEMLAGLAPGIAPESQYARVLAQSGCRVVAMTLISREDTFSGNPVLARFTNQPHREWVYRQAFELGRHIIGYEVEKVLALVDWFTREAAGKDPRIGVVGYGEGGLLALYAAALDTRIDAALVSGYFGPREQVWEEPIYRNVFGLLREFGDAEIASLIAPRVLVVEHSDVPRVEGPPPPREGRSGAAPGRLTTPTPESAKEEWERGSGFWPNQAGSRTAFISKSSTPSFNSSKTLLPFLVLWDGLEKGLKPEGPLPVDLRKGFDPALRQRRQLQELVDHTQRLLRRSEYVRADFWKKAVPSPTTDWPAATREYKRYLWDEVIGRFPPASLPANPRSRKVLERPAWTAYEVVLDVWPDVFDWGILLLPKELKSGERRPVVVCQHGLEGVPMDTITDDPKAGGFGPYQAFAARLAERGFITYAPHNPYRGGDRFRVLQRKANPLGKSLFSVILAQHDRLLDWLSELPFVDPARIGFYGLSYGGKTAVRVPPLLERYALSICSADYNEWIKKNATVDDLHSYLFTGEYEMVEFDLGNTFNYAELAWLVAPRPFMVERGHKDGVAPDEWVAYEYSKVRRLYAFLGIPERTEIEFFNGPHTIHGAGTFEFLKKHLGRPER